MKSKGFVVGKDVKITVVKFVPYDEADKMPHAPIGGFGGWFNFGGGGQRWKDYIETWDAESRPYLEALKEKIVSENIHNGGFWHQEQGCPIFSDGRATTFSYRGWGDLMAAIWSEQDQKDYSYCDFAWTRP